MPLCTLFPGSAPHTLSRSGEQSCLPVIADAQMSIAASVLGCAVRRSAHSSRLATTTASGFILLRPVQHLSGFAVCHIGHRTRIDHIDICLSGSNGTISYPASSSSCRMASVSYAFTLQPRLCSAAFLSLFCLLSVLTHSSQLS